MAYTRADITSGHGKKLGLYMEMGEVDVPQIRIVKPEPEGGATEFVYTGEATFENLTQWIEDVLAKKVDPTEPSAPIPEDDGR